MTTNTTGIWPRTCGSRGSSPRRARKAAAQNRSKVRGGEPRDRRNVLLRAGQINPHKSLASYRECRRRKSWHNGRKFGPRHFRWGDLKEVADSTRYGASIGSLCNEGL